MRNEKGQWPDPMVHHVCLTYLLLIFVFSTMSSFPLSYCYNTKESDQPTALRQGSTKMFLFAGVCSEPLTRSGLETLALCNLYMRGEGWTQGG